VKHTVHIDLSKPPGLHGLLINRGAPKYLLRGKLTLTRTDVAASTSADYKSVPPDVQLAHLQSTLDDPHATDGLFVIGSSGDDARARGVALGIMQASMLGALDSTSHPRPLWWSVYGGRWDRLRDDESWRSSLGRVGMLVVSNVADNSTNEKIEKVVDLLHLYCNVPRVVVVDGADPLEFAATRLRRRPNRVLFLSRRGRTLQV